MSEHKELGETFIPARQLDEQRTFGKTKKIIKHKFNN
jgi:hypothetical protein